MESTDAAVQIRNSEDLPYDSRFPVDSSIFESGSFASRCSVRLIHEVVSKFDSTKRDLVKSIGFEGILHFPVFKQLNRKFCLWLMSCVDESTSAIRIHPEIDIKFTKTDVGHVFGIPSAGRRIIDPRVSCRDAKEHVLNEFLPFEFREHRSVKSVQEIIERSYVHPMSKIDRDRFRVAFVVFVVSNLLSPSAKYDYASIDYWNALRDPDSIISFDWSGFVVTRLLDAVTKLKKDISSNIKFPNITGCSIFLQVIYLDSLKLDGMSMVHNSLPRIRDFSYDKMRVMILADRNYVRHLAGDNDMPYGKLRDATECIYSWAVDHPAESEESRSACSLAAWECAVAMVNLLNIPLEAAGPVFVAVADFQEQIYAGLNVTGMQAIKFMNVIVSILIPYSREFSYQSSYGVESVNPGASSSVEATISNGMRLLSLPIRNKSKPDSKRHSCTPSRSKYLSWAASEEQSSRCSQSSTTGSVGSVLHDSEIGDDVQRSIKSVIASLDGLPHHLNVNLRVATAMSQFYSYLRTLKSAHEFDLNAPSPEECMSGQSSVSSAGSEYEVLPSPWELGYMWEFNQTRSEDTFEMIKRCHQDDSLAILHRSTKVNKVSWLALRSQIIGRSELDMDMFDATIRVATQEDDELYGLYGPNRWRHFFEADFMGSIMCGSYDLLDPNLANHLPVVNGSYDMSKSKLIFFPALVQNTWVCYVWNLEKNIISVFEPSYRHPVPDGRVAVIERSCYLLKLALRTLSRGTFNGILANASSTDLRIITISDDLTCRLNRSGLLCAMFCRCYDGSVLVPCHSEIVPDRIAAKIFEQLKALKDNQGSFGKAG